MAKVLNPLNSTEARGRVGGLVYNTWRGIRTVKTHTKPAHPLDPLRHAHFVKIRDAGKLWATIGDTLRSQWNDYADQHPDIDWTGKPLRLAGYHWFVRIITTFADINVTPVLDPPSQPCECPPPDYEIYAGDNYIDVNPSYDPSIPLETYKLQWWITKPLSGGRNATIHDAYFHSYSWREDPAKEFFPLDYGWYTIFVRPIRINALKGPFQSLRIQVPPWG